jgi:hypothetical protein
MEPHDYPSLLHMKDKALSVTTNPSITDALHPVQITSAGRERERGRERKRREEGEREKERERIALT